MKEKEIEIVRRLSLPNEWLATPFRLLKRIRFLRAVYNGR
jgi:hypothetical protein